jgi:hypothetical protein
MTKYLLYLLLLISPVINRAGSDEINPDGNDKSGLFSQLHLSEFGLSNEVFRLAMKGFHELDLKRKLQNSTIITIIDFSQSSTKKRMYVIDILKKVLLYNTYVAHGRNTGEEYARHFSNEFETHKSSLGFYITENPSVGSKVGPSLIIKGVEKGFNDNALQRAIIMHGADYASEEFIHKYGRLGRSFGCPAIPTELIKPVSETIKGGTCMFIYYPDKNYLYKSSLLHHSESSESFGQQF